MMTCGLKPTPVTGMVDPTIPVPVRKFTTLAWMAVKSPLDAAPPPSAHKESTCDGHQHDHDSKSRDEGKGQARSSSGGRRHHDRNARCGLVAGRVRGSDVDRVGADVKRDLRTPFRRGGNRRPRHALRSHFELPNRYV